MPGIGVRTGARILLEVGDGTSFPTSGHLTAYAGLAPVTRRSGLSIRGEHPSRAGNKQLKRAFFLAAYAAPSSAGLGSLADAAVLLLTAVLRNTTGNALMGTTLLQVLRQYVRDHLPDPELSVAAMAAANFVSIRQVHRVLSDSGESPAAYIRRLRLNKASDLLRRRQHNTPTISAISTACGFSDPVVFSRAFAREFGTTPSQWTTGCEGSR